MDDFPHITVEHKILKRHVKFRFNPERCRQAGLEETPNADKYEVIKLGRVYHFNKNTSDHVILTIPKPLFVVVDKDYIPEENSLEFNHNGESTTEQETTYQNVKNKNRNIEEFDCDSSTDEVVIEKCVPEVVTKSNTRKKQTKAFNNITKYVCTASQPKSTIISDEKKSEAPISETNNNKLNNQDFYSITNDSKTKPILTEQQLDNIAVDAKVQNRPTDLVADNIQSNINRIVPAEELSQAPHTNNEIIEDELDALGMFDELCINEQILNEKSEENYNSPDIMFGIPSEIFEPIPIQEISATDEILWTEFCESSPEGVIRERLPEFYQEDLRVLDPVEEEMEKIHRDYVIQEHSYVQPIITEEDTEFFYGRNVGILNLFKIQEPVVEKQDFQIQRPTDEPFEMQPLVLDEENDEHLGNEIRKFIVTQEHCYNSVKSLEPVATTQENFNSCSTIKTPINCYDTFKTHLEIQEPTMQENFSEREKPMELTKVQEDDNPKQQSVVQTVEMCEIEETAVDKNTSILDNFEEPITFSEKFEIQRKVDVEPVLQKNLEKHVHNFIQADHKVVDNLPDSVAKYPKIVAQPIQDSLFTEKNSENLEQPFQNGPVTKNYQKMQLIKANLNKKRAKVLEKSIQDESKILEQPMQSNLNARQPKCLVNAIRVKMSRILKKPVQDDAITKMPKICEKYVQANLNERESKFMQKSLRDGSSIVKDTVIDEQPIQVDLIAKEPRVLEKLIQTNLDERGCKFFTQFVQDSSIVKAPQPIQSNFNERQTESFENAVQDDSVYEPVQSSTAESKTETSKKSKLDHKKQLLEKPIRDIFIDKGSKILEKNIQNYFTPKNPETLLRPVHDHILNKPKNMETFFQTPIEKVYTFLNKPLVNPTKNLKDTSEEETKILKKRLLRSFEKVPIRYAIEQKPKILEKSLLNFMEKPPNIVQNSSKCKRQKITKTPLRGIIDKVPVRYSIKQKPNILKKSFSNVTAKEPKIIENSVDSNKHNMAENRCGVNKMLFVQNLSEQEQKIIESPTSSQVQDSRTIKNTIEGNGHDTVEICGGSTTPKMSNQNLNEQKSKILEKSFSSSIEKDPKIIENPIGSYEHNMVERYLDGTIEKTFSSSTDKNFTITGNSNRDNGQKLVDKSFDDPIAKMPSLSSSTDKDSKIVENPIKCKRLKMVKKSLKNTIDNVPKIPKKSLQRFESMSKTVEEPMPTLSRNKTKILEVPFKSTSENEFDEILEKPFQETIEKVLKFLDKAIENESMETAVATPARDNVKKQLETSDQKSKIVKELFRGAIEKEQNIHDPPENSIQDTIQNGLQISEKPIQDATSNKPHTCSISSPNTYNGNNIFEEEMDYPDSSVLTSEIPDPLDEEMRRIHEDSINIQKNNKSFLATPNKKEPIDKTQIFVEPFAKKSRIDYPEEEEGFRGFTREEQNKSLELKTARYSPFSAIESVHDRSICSTVVMELKENVLNNPMKQKQLNERIRGSYKCNECDFKTSKRSHLKVHVRTHVQPFWCNLCLEMFEKIEDLEYHVKGSHAADKNNCKSDKNKNDNDVVRLEKNLRNSRTGEKHFNKTVKQAYKCGFCNYSSTYVKRLQRHMNVHTREKLYSCDQCEYVTLIKWMIERHKHDHGKETKQYECDECGYISIYRDQLDEHLQLHSGRKVYKCDKCLFSTAHLGYFNAHVSFHQPKIECSSEYGDGDEQEVRMEPQTAYTCEECGWCTRQHAALFQHGKKAHENQMYMRVFAKHNNKDIYMCTKCGFWAQSKGPFNKHLMIHTDIKPNKCQLCGFITDNEFNLKVHEANHASDTVFKCAKCGKNCLTLQRLKNHTVKVHNGDIGVISVE